MLKGYKYRIYPDERQKEQIAKTFGCTRFVYNYYLALRIDLYKTEGKSMSALDCNHHLNQVLKAGENYLWLKEVDKFSLTNAIYNLDSSYQNFFRAIKRGNNEQGFPKFKSNSQVNYVVAADIKIKR